MGIAWFSLARHTRPCLFVAARLKQNLLILKKRPRAFFEKTPILNALIGRDLGTSATPAKFRLVDYTVSHTKFVRRYYYNNIIYPFCRQRFLERG